MHSSRVRCPSPSIVFACSIDVLRLLCCGFAVYLPLELSHLSESLTPLMDHHLSHRIASHRITTAVCETE